MTGSQATPDPTTSTREIVRRAREFAVEAHGTQTYAHDEQPYVYHLDRVAELVAEAGYEAQVVAYLHDVLEDTEVTGQQIVDRFGVRVTQAVSDLTDSPGNRAERHAAMCKRMKTAMPLAVNVKIADRLANVRAAYRYGHTEIVEKYRRELHTFVAAVEDFDPLNLLPELIALLDTLPEAGEREPDGGIVAMGYWCMRHFAFEGEGAACLNATPASVYVGGTPPSSEGVEYQWYALQSDIDKMMQDESYNLLPEEFEIDPGSVFNERGEEVGAVKVLILPSSTATESGSSGIGESEPVSGDVSADSPGQARVASPSEEVEALMRERGLTEHDATEVVKFKAHLANVNGLPLDQWTGEDREYAGLPKRPVTPTEKADGE